MGEKRQGFFGKLSEDIRNYDRLNKDAEKVVKCHYFSGYRGARVIRTNRSRSGAFGVIFLKRALLPETAADEVRHEFGHVLQLKLLGVLRFIFRIALPSLRSDPFSPTYYNAPWEVTADVFGGVTTRPHSQEEIAAGMKLIPRK